MPTNPEGYYKAYYEKNYDKIYKNQMKKVTCIHCNCKSLLCNLSKHKKTKKHLKNVEKSQKIESI